MDKKPILDSQAYITLGYLTVVVIGMMFEFSYFNKFSINIFEYADVLDFLLTPVKNIEVIVFAMATFIIVYIFFRLDKLWQDKSPKTHKRFNFGMTKEFATKYRPIMFGGTLILYFFLAADFYGDIMYKKYQKSTEMLEIIYESDQRMIKGKLIGKNTDYIFLETSDSEKGYPSGCRCSRDCYTQALIAYQSFTAS